MLKKLSVNLTVQCLDLVSDGWNSMCIFRALSIGYEEKN